MPLVTTNEMLKKAQAGHYAVGAFNVENMEMVMAVIKAAEEMNSPVIMQTTPSTVKYAGLDYYLAMVRTAAERASVPVAIHLDHGSSFELAMQALRTGYTSIMIDGSHGSFEENVALTRRVADACLPSQISVEAELGKVGGKEDDLEAENDSPYTDPQQAKEFAERTNATSLAVAIGTAHGLYQGTPKLDFERLAASKLCYRTSYRIQRRCEKIPCGKSGRFRSEKIRSCRYGKCYSSRKRKNQRMRI